MRFGRFVIKMKLCNLFFYILLLVNIAYCRNRQPLARVPKLARETFFHGTPKKCTIKIVLYKHVYKKKIKKSSLNKVFSVKKKTMLLKK